MECNMGRGMIKFFFMKRPSPGNIDCFQNHRILCRVTNINSLYYSLPRKFPREVKCIFGDSHYKRVYISTITKRFGYEFH